MRIGIAQQRREKALLARNTPIMEIAHCKACQQSFQRATQRKRKKGGLQLLDDKSRVQYCSEECRGNGRAARKGIDDSAMETYWNKVKMDSAQYADEWRDRRRSAS